MITAYKATIFAIGVITIALIVVATYLPQANFEGCVISAHGADIYCPNSK